MDAVNSISLLLCRAHVSSSEFPCMYVHDRNYDIFSIMILQYIVKKVLLWSVLCHFIESILCHGGLLPLSFSCDINIIIFDQRSTIAWWSIFFQTMNSSILIYISKNRSLCTVWEAVVRNCCRQHPILCGRNSRLLYYHDRPIKLLLYWKFCRILIVVIFSTFVGYIIILAAVDCCMNYTRLRWLKYVTTSQEERQ